MIELPEVKTLARQLHHAIAGQRVTHVSIAETRPKFMFLQPEPEALSERLTKRTVVRVTGDGKWIFARLDNNMTFLLGEMFGRILLVRPDEPMPSKVHACVSFDSGAKLVVSIQAWGGFQVLTPTELKAHPYAGSRGLSPIDEQFTFDHFHRVLDARPEWSKKPIKAFLVHEGNVAGIGNGMLQDILFRAKLSPKRKVPTLSIEERKRLYRAVVETIRDAVRLGGRDTEKDLYGNPGRYVPQMDRRTAGTPCPDCGAAIVKISYLGGSCYLCPDCQPS